jgi:dsRNA-specific ribonuclease
MSVATIRVKNVVLGRGEGKSKDAARKRAAKAAYTYFMASLEKEPDRWIDKTTV